MLTELYVEHFVLIDALRLQFGQGLHVFTGETGAGKSLLLDATRLVLGGRANSSSIQRDAHHALVEAVFGIDEDSLSAKLLHEWEMDVQEGVVVLSRTLYRTGRTTCRVNGRTVTVQMLKTLGDTLVEMQGQHESHALLTEKYQKTLLDLYGRHQTLCREVADVYHKWKEATQVLKEAQVSERERAQQMDMLRFQIDEIERANVEPGEEDKIRDERQRLVAYGKLRTHLDSALLALEDTTKGAIAQLGVAETEVAEIVRRVRASEDIVGMLNTARANAEEAAFTLSRFVSSMDADPERLERLEDRLAILRSLMRKYGPSVEDVLSHLAQSEDELKQLLDYDQFIESHQQEVATHKSAYMVKSEELFSARLAAAATLQNEVELRLQQLRMGDVRFSVAVSHDENVMSEDGSDKVEFLFSGNPGEPLHSMQKVASGGELSRTLLALKVVVADLEQIDTLIFDEIDTGVSGDAALRVAELLRSLGRNRQVLCVTHSAQVSAAGHKHFQISKAAVGERVRTEVISLDDTARTQEVGRLLGAGISDNTAFQHAKALLTSFTKDAVSSS